MIGVQASPADPPIDASRFPVPANEAERLAELRRYQILDTAPEAMFDDIVRLAKQLFKVDTSVISLIDDDRQWFKARAGIDVCETGRDVAFCAHAITSDDILIVPDATTDVRFRANPLVVGPPFIRFYAGAPLTTPSGFVIGTLCIFDAQLQPGFGVPEREHLASLAVMVCDRLNVRRFRLEREQQAGSILEIADALTDSARRLDRQSKTLVGISTESARRSSDTVDDVRRLTEAGVIVTTALGAMATNVMSANLDADATSVAIMSMGGVVSGIGKVANQITTIATESRVLSINASIEAARYGEASLGFRVVADEVKQLAAKTSTATKNIVGELREVSDKVAVGIRHCQRLNETMAALEENTQAVARQANLQRTANDRVLTGVEDMVAAAASVQHQAIGVGDASMRLLNQANLLKSQAASLGIA